MTCRCYRNAPASGGNALSFHLYRPECPSGTLSRNSHRNNGATSGCFRQADFRNRFLVFPETILLFRSTKIAASARTAHQRTLSLSNCFASGMPWAIVNFYAKRGIMSTGFPPRVSGSAESVTSGNRRIADPACKGVRIFLKMIAAKEANILAVILFIFKRCAQLPDTMATNLGYMISHPSMDVPG